MGRFRPELYKPERIDEIFEREREWSRRCFLAVLGLLGVPQRFVDLGCGAGYLVETARALGVDAIGVELWLRGGEGLQRHDLRRPLDLPPADLVYCVEVGEHLPEQDAPMLARNVAAALAEDGHAVFTAAPPGQDGEGHINPQFKAWWEGKLYEAGLRRDPVLTERVRSAWAWASGPLFWLPENVMVLVRR